MVEKSIEAADDVIIAPVDLEKFAKVRVRLGIVKCVGRVKATFRGSPDPNLRRRSLVKGKNSGCEEAVEHWQQNLKVAGEDLQAGGTDAPQKADPLTLEAYLSSKLCLAPAGDTPTSRRLFDSMAAGCLPVLMAPAEDIMPNLPFPKAIDWPQTVLFGGGLSCSLRDNADATIRWLQSLLEPENERKLQCMARRAQKVFP